MDKMLYLSMTGAAQSMAAQNIHANNLANVDTVGFKADYAQAISFPVHGDTFPSRVYALSESAGVDYEQGSLISTGRDLDIAIEGEGWLAVTDAQGNEAFTRSGELFVEASGFVKTRTGLNVMGNAGPLILPEFEKIEIGADGTVSVRALGQGPEGLAAVDRIKLVNPDLSDLQKGADGLFRRKDGLVEPPEASVRVVTGALEGSNVNAVESMLAVLSAARSFEMQVKMMNKAEEMDQASARLLHLG